ncbi:MAG: UvrD-helicase domain-containing protein [Bacteroidales bacterium]|jgi:DNA helicase-2/ATP-dependent DNA helicase PcrA|nr:UvrD-helicase domain-containing protein [Bacteroidales bacterium]
MSNILSDLNPEQIQAAAHIDGPLMIIAGAGSGKTRTLTYRIANLLQHHVDPFNILALTFTNKAAREMKERISNLIGTEAKSVWMGTFHSIFARVLRVDGELLGYPRDFTIYDTDDCKSLIRAIVKEQNLDSKTYPASQALSRISNAKSSLMSPEEYLQNAEIRSQDVAAKKPMIGEIYKIYNERLKRSSAMDFDDLLFNMNLLLRDFPDILAKYQRRFRYILVDEYQDTNYAQYLIVKKLAAAHQNICVVGDDAQSIYAFRGANIQNILNFRLDYPTFQTFKLEQNYRSTKTIVGGANSIISKNRDQIHKEIWTENIEGEKIHLSKCDTDKAEGLLVARQIFDIKMNEHLQNNDFVVLYRTNNQSRSIEDALRQLNIPYRIYGGQSFYQRKEIKDVLAYFRLAVNPHDQEALLRVINYPARGIGQTTIERLRVLADQHQVSLWDIVSTPTLQGDEINSGTRLKLDAFAVKVKSLNVGIKTTEAFEMATQIWLASGIKSAFDEEDTLEAEMRLRNVDELLNAVKDFTLTEQQIVNEETGEISFVNNEFRTLDEFMSDIALITDADMNQDDDKNKVSLMTIHAAKGLEFPCVFVVGMEENLFPSSRSVNTRAELEEERRLFYVAVTRAEKKLFLSFAENRFIWGQYTFCEPSRFLEEIDPIYLDNPEVLEKTSVFERHEAYQTYNKPKQTFGSNFRKVETETPRFAGADVHVRTKIHGTDYKSAPAKPKNLMSMSEAKYTLTPQSASVSLGDLQENQKVQHEKFGTGIIKSVEQNGEKIVVLFDAVGEKTLLTKFAKLKVL